MNTTPTPPKPPSQELMLLRARWLLALPPDERDALGDLPLREVDALFDAWREAGGDSGDDAE
jgi:hypothetical protein